MKIKSVLVWTQLVVLLLCVGLFLGACRTVEQPVVVSPSSPDNVTRPLQQVQDSLKTVEARNAPIQESLNRLVNSEVKSRKQAYSQFSDEYAQYHDSIVELVTRMNVMTKAMGTYIDKWDVNLQKIDGDATLQFEARKRHEEASILLNAMVNAATNLVTEYLAQTNRLHNLKLALDSDPTGPGLKTADKAIANIGIEATNLMVKTSGTIKAINRLAGELLPNGLDWGPMVNPAKQPALPRTPQAVQAKPADNAPDPKGPEAAVAPPAKPPDK